MSDYSEGGSPIKIKMPRNPNVHKDLDDMDMKSGKGSQKKGGSMSPMKPKPPKSPLKG